jgi:putative redox protein
MVRIEIEYQGGLRTEATHGPSGTRIVTDAPRDNEGRGESFSPTDLVATGLGACILTIMGIVARRHDWDLAGARATVTKGMVADPERRIGSLAVEVRVPQTLDDAARKALERAALTCPVHRTLGDRVEMPVTFHWGS